mgnify:CR=1 FL=1
MKSLSALLILISTAFISNSQVYKLPELGYSYQEYAPYIDAKTMEIHHTKHHQGYTNNLNNAIAGTALEGKSIEAILGGLDMNNGAVRNNGGGFYNHCLFWDVMNPEGKGYLSGELKDAIILEFGSVEAFKDAFAKAAATRFGSGWAWLIRTADGALAITSTANQDNPLMDLPEIDRGTPLLGLDVWEHAYYLNYQNRRPDYIAAWWDLVNWNEVNRRFSAAAA